MFETRVGRLGVAICYDRHFPEYMRALALGGADIVAVPQAGVADEWPAGFFEGELCTAAFQNGYFVALCNRVGVEDRLNFAGESFICGPDGAVRARAPRGEDHILIADIDLADTARSHARRNLLKDRRPDLYEQWFTQKAEGTPHCGGTRNLEIQNQEPGTEPGIRIGTPEPEPGTSLNPSH